MEGNLALFDQGIRRQRCEHSYLLKSPVVSQKSPDRPTLRIMIIYQNSQDSILLSIFAIIELIKTLIS